MFPIADMFYFESYDDQTENLNVRNDKRKTYQIYVFFRDLSKALTQLTTAYCLMKENRIRNTTLQFFKKLSV